MIESTRPGLIAGDRGGGFSLIELLVSLSMFTVGLLGFLNSFYAGFSAYGTMQGKDDAHVALQNVAESLRSVEFSELYATYDGAKIEVPGLKAPDGGVAVVEIKCYTDEYEIPPEFGEIFDLDGKGGIDSHDVSGEYRLLPVRLVLAYDEGGDVDTHVVYMVLGEE